MSRSQPSHSGNADSEIHFFGDASVDHSSSCRPTFLEQGCPFRRREPDIRVELCDEELWNEFNSIGTEMVLTKVGRRVFPSFRVRFNGLQSHILYKIMMDVERMDENRYKFQNGCWTVSGKGEVPFTQQTYVHPLSSHSGEHIMNSIVSFHKIKLTNSPSRLTKGTFLLHSMHRYQLRVHIARCDIPQDIYSFTFPQTNFISVTAYQNDRLSQLKIANNPFARGFRPDGARGRVKEERCLEECEEPEAKRLRDDLNQSVLMQPCHNARAVTNNYNDTNPYAFATVSSASLDPQTHSYCQNNTYHYAEQPHTHQTVPTISPTALHEHNQFYAQAHPHHQISVVPHTHNQSYQWQRDYHASYPNHQFSSWNETRWNNGQENYNWYQPQVYRHYRL